jgi:hypothetical protein
MTIKNISGWWYLVNAGAFHMFPFPTKADAEEALANLKEQTNDRLPRHDVLSVLC